MIWNSCTASCDTVDRTPFVELSVASAPSTLTRLERARCPLIFSPEVGAAPRLGALSCCTWESHNSSRDKRAVRAPRRDGRESGTAQLLQRLFRAFVSPELR